MVFFNPAFSEMSFRYRGTRRKINVLVLNSRVMLGFLMALLCIFTLSDGTIKYMENNHGKFYSCNILLRVR